MLQFVRGRRVSFFKMVYAHPGMALEPAAVTAYYRSAARPPAPRVLVWMRQTYMSAVM